MDGAEFNGLHLLSNVLDLESAAISTPDPLVEVTRDPYSTDTLPQRVIDDALAQVPGAVPDKVEQVSLDREDTQTGSSPTSHQEPYLSSKHSSSSPDAITTSSSSPTTIVTSSTATSANAIISSSKADRRTTKKAIVSSLKKRMPNPPAIPDSVEAPIVSATKERDDQTPPPPPSIAPSTILLKTSGSDEETSYPLDMPLLVFGFSPSMPKNTSQLVTSPFPPAMFGAQCRFFCVGNQQEVEPWHASISWHPRCAKYMVTCHSVKGLTVMDSRQPGQVPQKFTLLPANGPVAVSSAAQILFGLDSIRFREEASAKTVPTSKGMLLKWKITVLEYPFKALLEESLKKAVVEILSRNGPMTLRVLGTETTRRHPVLSLKYGFKLLVSSYTVGALVDRCRLPSELCFPQTLRSGVVPHPNTCHTIKRKLSGTLLTNKCETNLENSRYIMRLPPTP